MNTGMGDIASASSVATIREFEKRAKFLAEQAASYALDAPEAWYADGHLDYDMFTGLLADALVRTVFMPLLRQD